MPTKHGAPRPKAAAKGSAVPPSLTPQRGPKKISTRIRVRCPMKTIEVREHGKVKRLRVPDLAPFVAKGAPLLDERVPGWWRKIAVSRLKLSSPEECVVGQLAIKAMLNGPLAGYFDGVKKLFAEVHDPRDDLWGDNEFQQRVAAEHGFAFPKCLADWLDDDHDEVREALGTLSAADGWLWEQLNDLWVAEIQARRAMDKAAKKVAAKKGATKAAAKAAMKKAGAR